MNTPSHYAPTGSTITPWELQKQMESSHNAFVDARRADGMEYAFRVKGGLEGLMEDLKKGAHCFLEAAEFLRLKLEEKEGARHAVAEQQDLSLVHNPDRISTSLLPRGFRFLLKKETYVPELSLVWTDVGWIPCDHTGGGPFSTLTYAVQLPSK